MMLVQILKFGTNWWARFGQDHQDPCRYTRHAAYYNSTGVHCGRKVRRHWIVPGLIRFNGVGGFNPHLPNRSIGATFLCSDPAFLFGGNRLLFKTRMPESIVPEWHLVVISSAVHGPLNFSSDSWRSPQTQIIAVSQLREMQEAMLLMKTGDWVQTSCGFWQLFGSNGGRSGTGLELVGDQPVA